MLLKNFKQHDVEQCQSAAFDLLTTIENISSTLKCNSKGAEDKFDLNKMMHDLFEMLQPTAQ